VACEETTSGAQNDLQQVTEGSSVLFDCDDIHKTYEELRAKGVEFAEAPTQQFWGWWTVFKDPDGNTYGLGQRGGE
jgi:predicted enzyme related to lactoylglutathione lyase